MEPKKHFPVVPLTISTVFLFLWIFNRHYFFVNPAFEPIFLALSCLITLHLSYKRNRISKRIFIFSLTIIIILALIIVGMKLKRTGQLGNYYYFLISPIAKSQANKYIENQTWKTYFSNQHGIIFDYPSMWFIEVSDNRLYEKVLELTGDEMIFGQPGGGILLY